MLEKWEDDYWLTVKARTVLFPETLNTLEGLARCYMLAVITNTQAQAGAQKHRLIETPHLTDYFKTVIVAGESGIPPKPDRNAFMVCLKTLSIDPDQAVYVGDDWYTDIRGAAEVGIQPIWIKHHLLSRSWPQPDTDVSVPVITSLDSLLEIDSIIS
jgi:putative hydrolase of the HAD superfamily